MKLKSLIYTILFAGSILSCQKQPASDPEYDTLTLKMSAKDIILDVAEREETAATFTWSTGHNYGTGKAIMYSLNFAKADGTYDPDHSIGLGKHLYSISYTVEQMNDLLTGLIPVSEIGTSVSFKVLLTATVPGVENIQTAELIFTATTYRALPEVMHVGGSSLGEGTIADMLNAENGIFVWQGELNTGEITVFSKDHGTVLTRQIDEAGRYSVIADLIDDDVTLESAGKVYFVCEEDGWAFSAMQEKAPGVHTVIRDLKSGQFKFGTVPDIWYYMYVSAEKDNASWDSDKAIFREDGATGNDWKWFIWNSVPVPYEITLDISGKSPKMIMTPYNTEISMIGSATQGGWSLDDRTVMKRERVMEFCWSGHLNEGELKFCCGNSPEYGRGEWFMPEIDNQEFTPMENQAIDKIDASSDNAPDRKWHITQAGEYSIILNQYTHSLTIKEN
ncbi:MAG: SusF/SusE family outer membrane protein [Bacteroidales bacterium]|nr:SusF/SusE family outer membrane protein [Bacteroidales bacterium]